MSLNLYFKPLQRTQDKSGVVARQSYEILIIVASTCRRDAKLDMHLFCLTIICCIYVLWLA